MAETTPSKSISTVSEEFDAKTKKAYETIIKATIASNGLPKKTNFAFCQSFPKFRDFMDERGIEILNMAERLYNSAQFPISMQSTNFKQHLSTLHNVNEKILERVDKNLNKLLRNRNDIDPIIVEAQSILRQPNQNASSPGSSTIMRAILARNVVRPQNSFSDRIDNSVDTPWVPRIQDKPNSIKPLAIFLEETTDEIGQGYSHPYELELNLFKPMPEQLTKVTSVYPKPIEEVPLKMVSTTDELQELYKDLLNQTEIAIDLEHHSYRSFQGITCLMQISTPETDYIVDTLTLRNDLHILNEIFTKPTVVKVLHGAVFDIQWLQRDLSLYIVNLFDTQIAARQLNFAQLSLKALIYKFCKRQIDKTFQLADWRIRPLPQELINYAREDTHYLLYIYHILRNDLLKQSKDDTNSLQMVLSQSTELCKQRYIKPKYTPETYLNAYHASRKAFNNRQLLALRQLYHWREMTARTEDESLGYVLPTHMMLQIAETLPREQQGIIACCNPVPPLVRQNLLTLNKMLIKARIEPLEQPILQSEPTTRQQVKQYGTLDWETPLNCPHDLSKDDEFSEHLPTLLKANRIGDCGATTFSKSSPTISVFDDVPVQTMENSDQVKYEKVSFLCPYDRYKLIKEYAKDEKAKEHEDKQQQNVAGVSSEVVPENEEINKLKAKVNEKLKEIMESNEETKEAEKPKPADQLQDTTQAHLSLNQMKRKRKHEKIDGDGPKKISKTNVDNSTEEVSYFRKAIDTQSDYILMEPITVSDNEETLSPAQQTNANGKKEGGKRKNRNRNKKNKRRK